MGARGSISGFETEQEGCQCALTDLGLDAGFKSQYPVGPVLPWLRSFAIGLGFSMGSDFHFWETTYPLPFRRVRLPSAQASAAEFDLGFVLSCCLPGIDSWRQSRGFRDDLASVLLVPNAGG